MDTQPNTSDAKPQAQPATQKTRGLTVSARAIVEIQKLVQKREKRPLGLRVGIRGGGCTGFGYLFEWQDEEPRATDRVFECTAPDGETVRVYCDPKSLIYLDGTELDYETSIMGHGFKFKNPNVKGACGCGESVQF